MVVVVFTKRVLSDAYKTKPDERKKKHTQYIERIHSKPMEIDIDSLAIYNLTDAQ